MDQTFETLEGLISNAKKSIGKPYAKETIETKRKEIQELQLDFEKSLEDIKLTQSEISVKITKFNKLKTEAQEILLQHYNKRTTNMTENTSTTMDISELSQISKLIQTFTGKKEDLNTFIANIELVNDTVPDAKKNSLFNFIFKSKIDTKVQNRIKQEKVPTNVNELITALRKSYKPTKNANNILNELTRIVQRGDNVTTFAAKIENLMTDLNELQISEIGESNRTTIVRTNNIIAFNAFKNGLKDQQTVSTIEASRVKTFSEALQIAEESSSRVSQQQILYQNVRNFENNRSNTFRGQFQNQHNRSFRGNYNQYRGNNSNNRFYNNHRNTNNSQNFYNGNVQRSTPSNNHRHNFNSNNVQRNIQSNNNYRNNANRSRGNNGRNFNRNYRVNYAQDQGNSQSPEMAFQECFQESPEEQTQQ